MRNSKAFRMTACALFCAVFAVGVLAQGSRGKAEMKAGPGSITVDYGRPELKGRDMLAKLEVGKSWRMGSNQATVLATPVDLMFGSTKIAKGSYSLFLKREGPGAYQLVFNTQTGQWGTQHDVAKDVAAVPMKHETVATPVEALTIELKAAGKGGSFIMSWGTTKLSADFAPGQ